MSGQPDFESVFFRAAARAQEAAARVQSQVALAQEILEEPAWALRIFERPPELQAVILREANGRAWRGRFGNSARHLAEFIALRRLAARAYARSRHPGVREAWFEAAARTANALRIAGDFDQCERVLERLATIEHFAGRRGLTTNTVRSIQERSARRISFLVTLERARGNYERALSLSNWEVAKRRLLNEPTPIAAAYSGRCVVRLGFALELVGDERRYMLDAARRDMRKCLDHTSEVGICAAPLASLILWLARTGEDFEEHCSYLDRFVASDQPLPEAIALRITWARALAAARSSLADADAGLAACYERLIELERPTDAGIVALDRIRIRYEAGVPLGIVQLVLEAKARLEAASLTPETSRVLEALWTRALLAARSGQLRAKSLEPHLEAAHRALVRA